MTIAFIVYGPLDRRSGGFVYDRELADRLESRGHRVLVVSQKEGSLLRRIIGNGPALIRRIRKIRPDMILADELNHPSLFLTMGAIRNLGRPVVAIVHHLHSLERLPAFSRRLVETMERQFLSRMDGFLFNSDFTASSVETLIGRPPVPGIVVTPGAGNPVREPQIRNGPLRILFVGNMISRKGLHRLISAVADISDDLWELDVVGDSGMDPQYARRCRILGELCGGTSIRFHGRLDDEALEELRGTCDVLAVPSDHEGFGIVYLEAMRAGLVPVAARNGGAAQLIRDGIDGFLIDGDDIGSLRQVLERMARDPELRFRMARSARSRSESFPGWREGMDRAVDFLEGAPRWM